VLIDTGEPAADGTVVAADDVADLKLVRAFAKLLQFSYALVNQSKIDFIQFSVLPLEGKHGPAGENVPGKSFRKQIIATNARIASRQEMDVIVLGFAVPGRSKKRKENARNQPEGTHSKWVVGGESSQHSEHPHPSMDKVVAAPGSLFAERKGIPNQKKNPGDLRKQGGLPADGVHGAERFDKA
jgi:hypothetical protein